MNWKNVLIAGSVLLNVALVIYLVTGHGPEVIVTPAFAQNRSVSGGGFSITTANITSSRTALYVINNVEKRMIVYAFGSARGGQVEAIAARDLRSDFGGDLAGDLLMVPGLMSGSTDAVYVIDPVGKRLVAYNCRGTGKEVDVIGSRDLDKDFRAGK